MIYEIPWTVTDFRDCYFYHSMELPNLGLVYGDWDLASCASAYTSHYDFKGKRVLDVGAGTGFFSDYCEARGAEVVSFDFSEEHPAELAPDWDQSLSDLRAMKRSYWYCHKLIGSKNKAFYGNIYDLPAALGHFDVAIVGSILLHLVNPYGALKSISNLADTIIITDAIRPEIPTEHMVFRPYMERPSGDYFCWWYVPLQSAQKMLRSLGYTPREPVFLTAHGAKRMWSVPLYSLAGDKNKP